MDGQVLANGVEKGFELGEDNCVPEWALQPAEGVEWRQGVSVCLPPDGTACLRLECISLIVATVFDPSAGRSGR